jgi:hypothetical protein
METEPGEEAQVDFGTGAPVRTEEGKVRRPWVFRIVLSYSRKAYSETVWRQLTESFLGCLENAFRHFGGVPKRLVIDNLKAAVARSDWYDPEVHKKLQSFAQHYGTVFLPTKPYTPRHNRLDHAEFLELVLADELAVATLQARSSIDPPTYELHRWCALSATSLTVTVVMSVSSAPSSSVTLTRTVYAPSNARRKLVVTPLASSYSLSSSRSHAYDTIEPYASYDHAALRMIELCSFIVYGPLTSALGVTLLTVTVAVSVS